MEAPSELAARPIQARVESQTARHVIAPRILLRGAILAVTTAVAFHYSLASLVRDLAAQNPIGYLALVPVIAIALAVRTTRRPITEPAIHDRYSDYIIGVPLLLGALWMTIVLPIQLSLFYWTWRLDLLSLPLFIGGAIPLVFGLRALWRYRLPVAYLLLAWPMPHVWVVRHLAANLPGELVTALGGVGLVAIALALVAVGRSHTKGSPVDHRRNPGPAVRGARTALTLVLLAGLALAGADSAMARFEVALRDTGDSRLLPFDQAAAQLGGWSLNKRADAAPRNAALGAAIGLDQYRPQSDSRRLPATGDAAGPVSLDVFSTSDLRALSGYSLDVLYRFHGYRLLNQHMVDLGAGVIGHAVIYADPTGRTLWAAVYWDWPVRSGGRSAFQRLVLNQRMLAAPDPPAPPGPDILDTSPQLALVNWLAGGRPPLDSALLHERSLLIDTARTVVRAQVGNVGAGDRP